MLYKKINSILTNSSYILTDNEHEELRIIYNDIKQYLKDKTIYYENKDAVDLLIETNNLINNTNTIQFPDDEISRWTMFDKFKNGIKIKIIVNAC